MNKKGITLLALVITIIILILLAAVAIQLAFGEQGLISKANKTARDNSKAELFDIATTEFASMSIEDETENTNNLSFDNFYNSKVFSNNYNIINDRIIDKRNNLDIIGKKEFEDEFRLRFRNQGRESGKPIVNPITTEDTKITGIGIKTGTIIVEIGGNSYTGKVDNNNKFDIAIPKQNEGVEITVTQKIGNKIESVKTTVTVIKPKLGQLSIEKITNITSIIKGVGEAGAKVIANISGNQYETIVNNDNKFNLNIPMQEEGKTIIIHQEKEGKISSDLQSIIVEKANIEGEDINDTILKIKVKSGTENARRVYLRTTEGAVSNFVEGETSWQESFTETITNDSKNIANWGDGTKLQSYIIDSYYGGYGQLSHSYNPRRIFD